ncbi:hypothetical protein V5O48_010954 [Marasmius crinis-equi]|uniref:TPR-like protein n=1 Tax=Marasmius crinis-equi TaxID=585013 RepID=A0ABR3F6Z0_9AGAR
MSASESTSSSNPPGQMNEAASSHSAPGDKDCPEYADQMKAEGNEHFRAGRWEEALASYRVGLGNLPRRKTKSPPKSQARDDLPFDIEDEHDSAFGKNASQDKGKHPEGSLRSEEDSESQDEAKEDPYSQPRAVLNANIAACFMKLGDDKEVVAACTEALQDDPTYIKALQRRATSNEKLNTWSSLSSAQEGSSTLKNTGLHTSLNVAYLTDYSKLVDLLSESSERTATQRKLQAIKPRVEEAQKKETAEMMGKLKGIGNSILGKFGLSTDNFQFVPNGQGGYSMNFQQ